MCLIIYSYFAFSIFGGFVPCCEGLPGKAGCASSIINYTQQYVGSTLNSISELENFFPLLPHHPFESALNSRLRLENTAVFQP